MLKAAPLSPSTSKRSKSRSPSKLSCSTSTRTRSCSPSKPSCSTSTRSKSRSPHGSYRSLTKARSPSLGTADPMSESILLSAEGSYSSIDEIESENSPNENTEVFTAQNSDPTDILDETTLEWLGKLAKQTNEIKIHPIIQTRWRTILSSGLNKEERAKIVAKVPTPAIRG
ncbi:unnamed protein product [Psylliodes chrysocephalus]|uniref:Uncharacterized protein n=1 Tax=Psylliodes chrysocephalus TaxID=3402493 RepID=A0A9P0CVH7_9CUCU|nr:unnamed protein product [Psylliodes chrysocephala]